MDSDFSCPENGNGTDYASSADDSTLTQVSTGWQVMNSFLHSSRDTFIKYFEIFSFFLFFSFFKSFHISPATRKGKRLQLVQMLLLPFIPIMALVVQNALTVRAFNIVLKNLKDSISNLKKLKMHVFFLFGGWVWVIQLFR